MIKRIAIGLTIFAMLWIGKSIIEQTFYANLSEDLALKQVNGDKDDYARMRAANEIQKTMDYAVIVAGVVCVATVIFYPKGKLEK